MRQSIREDGPPHPQSQPPTATQQNENSESNSRKGSKSSSNASSSSGSPPRPPPPLPPLPALALNASSQQQNNLNKTQTQFQNHSQSPPRQNSSKNSTMTLEDLDIIKTIGTGTFGRVVLVLEKEKGEYSALKILALSDVIRLKQVEHVKNEKNILKQVSHPFIVNMKWHYKDEYNIYMLFDYVCGGELFSYLRSAGNFSSSTSSFYASEIVSALEYLHAKCIIYRDLKPENLLLDREGHLKITDFGFAKKLNDRTWTLCGTPEYLAPELIQNKGHNKAVDWWALGVLIYEMNCGFPPFFDDNNFSTYEKILAGKVEWPKNIDPVAKDLVKKLLAPDRTKRLGNMKNGAEDVKRHRWFKDYDWDDVYNKRLVPPIIPNVTHDGDTNCFDCEFEEESWRMKSISETDLELFADF